MKDSKYRGSKHKTKNMPNMPNSPNSNFNIEDSPPEGPKQDSSTHLKSRSQLSIVKRPGAGGDSKRQQASCVHYQHGPAVIAGQPKKVSMATSDELCPFFHQEHITSDTVIFPDYEIQKPCTKESVVHSLSPEQLRTGFPPHSFTSLQHAIKRAREPDHICLCIECDARQQEEMTSLHTLPGGGGSSTPSSSLLTDVTYTGMTAKKKLQYLMGLEADEEEEEMQMDMMMKRYPQGRGESYGEEEEEVINGKTEAMRKAQRYLREHKIFEFFQFLIAHLLSASPFDPIDFLINLLDKCLIYRTGIYDPPLLYDKRHIGCLFNLMDRMRSGFVDYQQYKTGMYTLGIKSFNDKPPMTNDGLITKQYFIEEAYECLKDLLNDMIRRRPKAKEKKGKRMPKAPPPSTTRSGGGPIDAF